MILPSKDSPVLQRSGIAQNSEELKAAVNNPAAVEENNKKNSKWLDRLFKLCCRCTVKAPIPGCKLVLSIKQIWHLSELWQNIKIS